MGCSNTSTFAGSKMKNKVITLLAYVIILHIVFCSALAEGSSYIRCDCNNYPCTCFIQRGDEGGFVEVIIQHLQHQGYVDKRMPTNIFSKEIEQAVIQFQSDNGLDCTGMMDDDTLTLLLWGMTPEILDIKRPLRSGDTSTYPDTVYIPTDGGKKRHAKPTCSGMYDPRKVSIRNAAKAGFDPCGRKGCQKDAEKSLHTK